MGPGARDTLLRRAPLARLVSDARALLDATRLFLARHEQALASGDPARGIEACEGLLEALDATLPQEVARVGGSEEARAVLARRVSELEGLAMQLKLHYHALQERNVDVLRLVALLTATRRSIRALQIALAHWAGAPEPHDALDAVRAARECLHADAPDAAAAALRHALARALVPRTGAGSLEEALARWSRASPRFDVEDARALAAELARGTDDAVRAWRWLDETEAIVHAAAMSDPGA